MSTVRILSALIFCLFASSSIMAQSETIEKIQIQGNQVVDEGTYLFHLESKIRVSLRQGIGHCRLPSSLGHGIPG